MTKSKIISLFYENKLTKECFENVVIEKRKVEIIVGEGRKNNIDFIVGNDTIWTNGEFKGNLDKRSIDKFKKIKKAICDVLIVKSGSELANRMGLNYNGFYHFNPHRLSPDSILAFRIKDK